MDFINRIIHALTELHPTHPMFVHFPIALTGAAFLFILLAYWRKNPSLEQTAFANIVSGFHWVRLPPALLDILTI